MSKWYVHTKKADFQEIAQRFGIDPVTARLIRNRDVIGEEAIDRYLNGTPDQLYDPGLLTGAREAARILADKILDGKKIRVIGDYDIDGVCATYILCDVLSRAGADVDYDIPDRMKDGYGMHLRMAEEAAAQGVDTLITCDNGISAIEPVARAKELGLTVIVTDHHQPMHHDEDGETVWDLPQADVIVNPHLPGDTYPFKGICGAVVAWKVMQVFAGLVEEERRSGIRNPDLSDTGSSASSDISSVTIREQYLAFAAFATVGDVMDLKDENRIIVKWGLKALEKTDNTGMQALIRACGLEGKKLSAFHIGFVLGPCVNAGGRLDTARTALEMFLTEDPVAAAASAHELTQLNEERKAMTQEQVGEALTQIETTDMQDDRIYVVYLPGCHESIAGIVAGKVRERFYHPVFILTDSQTTGTIKGSGRSIETWNMYEGLCSCADLLEQFGGHPMAAGLTLKKENLAALRRRLNGECTLTKEELTEKVMVDVAMPIKYINEKRIRELELLEPCGKGNEKPVFAEKDLIVHSARILGANRNTLKFYVESQDGTMMDALYFGDVQEVLAYLEHKFSASSVEAMLRGRRSNIRLTVLYYPSVNEYRGSRTLQITIRDYC